MPLILQQKLDLYRKFKVQIIQWFDNPIIIVRYESIKTNHKGFKSCSLMTVASVASSDPWIINFTTYNLLIASEKCSTERILQKVLVSPTSSKGLKGV